MQLGPCFLFAGIKCDSLNDSTTVAAQRGRMLRGMASVSVTNEQRHLLFVVDANSSSSSSGNHALPPQLCGPVCCMEHSLQQPDQLSISVLDTHVDVEEAAGHEHASSQPCGDTADTGSRAHPAHLTLKQLAALASSLRGSSGRAQAWKTLTAVVCSTGEACGTCARLGLQQPQYREGSTERRYA